MNECIRISTMNHPVFDDSNTIFRKAQFGILEWLVKMKSGVINVICLVIVPHLYNNFDESYPPSSTANATASLENSSMWVKLNSSEISMRLGVIRSGSIDLQWQIKNWLIRRMDVVVRILKSTLCIKKVSECPQTGVSKRTNGERWGVSCLAPWGARNV